MGCCRLLVCVVRVSPLGLVESGRADCAVAPLLLLAYPRCRLLLLLRSSWLSSALVWTPCCLLLPPLGFARLLRLAVACRRLSTTAASGAGEVQHPLPGHPPCGLHEGSHFLGLLLVVVVPSLL